MAELDSNGLLTYGERYLAEHKGGRQRALALLALEQYGPVLGIDATELELRAESVRSMDKDAARKFRKGLRKAGEALRAIQGSRASEQMESECEEISLAAAIAVAEAQAFDSTSPEDLESLEITEDPSDEGRTTSITDTESDDNGGAELENNHGTPADVQNDEGMTPEHPLREISWAEEASPAMRLFIEDITGEKMGNLTSDDEKRIIEYIIQSGLLPDTRQRKDGSKIDAEARLRLFFDRMGDIDNVAFAENSNAMAVAAWFRKIRQKAVAARERSLSQDDATKPIPNIPNSPRQNERSLDEEPVHVQLSVGWAKYLELPSEEEAALREMLNPEAKGMGMSENKMLVVERFRKLFIDGKGEIVAFDGVDRKKLAQAWKLFGLAKNTTNNRAILRPAETLAYRIASMKARYNVVGAEDAKRLTHEGMRELLDYVNVAEAERRSQENAQPEKVVKNRPLQVSFEGREPELVK